jgi:hypothetical protein
MEYSHADHGIDEKESLSKEIGVTEREIRVVLQRPQKLPPPGVTDMHGFKRQFDRAATERFLALFFLGMLRVIAASIRWWKSSR